MLVLASQWGGACLEGVTLREPELGAPPRAQAHLGAWFVRTLASLRVRPGSGAESRSSGTSEGVWV